MAGLSTGSSVGSSPEPSGKDNLTARKRSVRSLGRQVRRQLAPAVRLWKDRQITNRVLQSKIIQQAKAPCLYWNLPEEVDTQAILRARLETGQKVVLPGHSRGRVFFEVRDLESDLAPGATPGILEPREHCPAVAPESIDLFVLPGTAFDIYGHRIGLGGGFFDRVLARRSPDALVTALAYECQIFRDVPSDPVFDQRVDWIFSEETIYQHRRSEWTIGSLEECEDLAQCLADRARDRFQLGLTGPLGAGKTTFIRAFLRALGIEGPITSPSFILMNEHKGRVPVRHIDLYRLGDKQIAEEDLQMFLETLADFPGVVLIEWCNFGYAWLPLQIPQLEIAFAGPGEKRRLTLDTFTQPDALLHEVLQ